MSGVHKSDYPTSLMWINWLCTLKYHTCSFSSSLSVLLSTGFLLAAAWPGFTSFSSSLSVWKKNWKSARQNKKLQSYLNQNDYKTYLKWVKWVLLTKSNFFKVLDISSFGGAPTADRRVTLGFGSITSSEL